MICTAHQILCGWSNGELDGLGMWHVWGRGKVHPGIWWGNLKESNYSHDVDVDGKILNG